MKNPFRPAAIREGFETDENIQRASRHLRNGARAFPSATGRYLIEKVPVVQWISKYAPRWIVNDLIAGLTVGVILVPQALAYAKIAGIPLQDGLLASWLPGTLYFIMGTSKGKSMHGHIIKTSLIILVDVNTGPTSIIGLLTAQIIKQVTAGGYTPSAIAVAIAFSVGIYCLVMGLLKLGFLLEFVSHPVLTGFISAAALTIIIGQGPAIFGETNIGSGVANQIHDIFAKLPTTKTPTLLVGLTGILLLCVLQFLGKQWGKKNIAVWIISIGRNAITILLFTIISFAANKNLATPYFDLTGKIPSGLVAPKVPDLALVGKVFQPSLAVFIAAALEHIAIAKSFGRRNNYTIDQSQELTFLGVTNILNSFFVAWLWVVQLLGRQ
jgi:sodium-independent sulfate anion transporter 11